MERVRSGQVRQTYLREDIFVIPTDTCHSSRSSSQPQLCPAVATEVRILLYRRMSDTDLHRGRTQGARQAHTRLFWPCIWSLLTSHGTSFLLIFPDFTSKKVTLNSLLISKSMGLVWPIFSISDPCQNWSFSCKNTSKPRVRSSIRLLDGWLKLKQWPLLRSPRPKIHCCQFLSYRELARL